MPNLIAGVNVDLTQLNAVLDRLIAFCDEEKKLLVELQTDLIDIQTD